MSALRQIWYGFVGNLLFTLFAGVCTALGFGPNRWVEFLISGMPIFVTPGVVRLVFLLLASLTLASLLRNIIAHGAVWQKLTGIITSCLPFVVGAFYVTAVPEPDRHLSIKEFESIIRVFQPIANRFPNNIQVEAVSASPDAAGYGQQFMIAFHVAGLTVNGIAPTDNQAVIFPSSASVSSSQLRGAYIGVGRSPPDRAKQFQAALAEAGVNAPFLPWSGIGADDFVFVISFR